MSKPATPEPDKPGTDLEPVAPTGALAAFADDEWAGIDVGLDNWQHVGHSLPVLRSDMRPGGGWLDEVTGEKALELEVIILAAAPSRAYWAQEFGKGDAAPDCRSADMVRPDPGSPQLQSETCASCLHSEWGKDSTPPECGVRINALVYDVARQRLARVGFGGTAFKYLRRHISAFRSMVPPRPPMAFVTRITLEEVDGNGMRWLEPRFSLGEPVKREEAAPLIALRDEALAAWRSVLAEELASPEASSGTHPEFNEEQFKGSTVIDVDGEPLDEPF